MSCLQPFAIIASLTTLSACGGGGSGTESSAVPSTSLSTTAPSTTPSATPAAVQATPEVNALVVSFIDSKSKAPITSNPFSVNFGSDAVNALASLPPTQSMFFETSRFNLKSDLKPSNSQPVRISFTVTGAGFLSSAKDITIRSSGTTTVQVEVVSTATDAQGQLTSNPVGATGAKTSLATQSGVVSPGPNPITSSVNLVQFAGLAGPSTPSARVNVTVPVGAKVGTQTAGTFLPTANTSLDLFVNSYSPFATESLSLFPSSMVGARFRDSNGAIQILPRIRIDAAVSISAIGSLNDHEGHFSDPVEVLIDVPIRARDNSNGLFTALGQTADVYWFEPSTGLWILSSSASVTDLARGKDTVAMKFSVQKTGIYAIFKRPAACGLNVTLTRPAQDTRALNITVLTRGFLDGNVGITGTNYLNNELPEDAGAVYVTLPNGTKVGEAVLAAKGATESCPRQATVAIN